MELLERVSQLQALNSALSQVKAITEELCGASITSSAVSRAASQLDSELAKWRERPLGEYRFRFLDAYYEQVREDGHVCDLRQ